MSQNPLHILAEAGHSAPSADNSQPWIFYATDQELLLHADITKIQESCFDLEHPAILLTLGAVVENILQAAEFYDIALESEYFTPQASGLCARFRLTGDCHDVQTDRGRPPLFSRHTNRLPYRDSGLSQSNIDQLLALSSASARLRFFHDPADLSRWVDWVRATSEVRFQSPDIHEWFGQSLKFSPEAVAQGDGLDVNTFGLPMPGHLFLKLTQTWQRMQWLNKLNAYKAIAQLEGENVKKGAGLLAFLASDEALHGLEAGRLMQRAWILANALGISVQPYFVVTDQLYRLKNGGVPPKLCPKIEDLEREISDFFELKNETLVMLYRIGFCDTDPIYSLRKPLFIHNKI